MKKRIDRVDRKHQPPTRVRKGTVKPAKEKSISASRSFLIVGLGASAGGLEALEQFLSHRVSCERPIS